MAEKVIKSLLHVYSSSLFKFALFDHFITSIYLEDTLDLLVPLIATISQSLLVQNNPWTASKLSKGERGDDCRESLTKLLGFTTSKSSKNKPKCCVTGKRPVKCAHLIPCGATALQLANVGLTVDNVNDTANLVFWVYEIESCFDRLQLSFMKTNPLQDKLFLKIWDESIRGKVLYHGSSQTINDIDGWEIKLEHKVYTRLLAYQAYQACVKYGSDDRTIRQSLYGSPGNYTFRSQADLLLSQFQKDIEEEIDGEIDEHEPRAAGGGGGRGAAAADK